MKNTENNKSASTQTIPLLPLRGLTIFPGMLLHFDAGREKSIQALETVMKGNRLLFLVAQRDMRNDAPELHDLYRVGTVSKVRQILKLPGDNVRVLVEGVHRAELLRITETDPLLVAEISFSEEKPARMSKVRLEALIRKTQETFETYMELAPKLNSEMITSVFAANDPGYLADLLAQNIHAQYEDKQAILEEFNPVARLRRLLALLLKEIEILKIEQGIQNKLRYQMDKNQKNYYLREQMRAIQEELDEAPDGQADAEIYREKILALRLPAEAEEKLLKEAARLAKLQYQSPESGVIRTYLDTCLALPWNKATKEKEDLAAAEKILDADHYGLKKVKERVLEYLAVRQLSKEQGSQILCLVGPPGTGKTSVASSIARASGRKFARLSLGGVRDEADIRGHRKTYIGAMPGRIVTALIQANSKNCVLLLDEVDKMGNDFRGDPASALLEVLDSAQNAAFRDHYIELPFDLSQVMFITTANTMDTIPRPLLDRMEVIQIEGYTDEEKVHIAKGHLLPKLLKKHGLKKSQMHVADDALRQIIAEYTREAGVRTFERQLARLCRKTARSLLSGDTKRVHVTADNVASFLGVPKYKKDRRIKTDRVGVVNGLAWTSAGGELLEVEAAAIDGSGRLELTGNLGNVMKESAKAAITYIRSQADLLGVDKEFYKNKDMHLHFPEGATPKDGPSAGIATATALLSALTGRPVKSSVAMTGEITLRGRVLPIGGLKEKTMAAYREGIRTVILPEENLPDLEEIDETVRDGLTFIPVASVDRVFAEAFADTDRKGLLSLAETGWPKQQPAVPQGPAIPAVQ